MATSPPVYLCQGLTKRREGGGTIFELKVPELRIAPGEVVVLRGPSGCGKSTLLDMLALALRPDQADAFSFRPQHRGATDLWRLWQRNDLDGLGTLRGSHIGDVLQTGGLLSFLTARENASIRGLRDHREPRLAARAEPRRAGAPTAHRA